MRSVALVMLVVGAAAAAIHEFESDFPRPDDLFLYTIERSRREEALTSTTTTITTTTEASTTTAVLSTTPIPSTTTTTLAPITAVTTALPIIATTPLAPITVTALPLNLVQQPALTLPGAALGGYPSGLQLNHLGWAGQPYKLGLQSFPTGGYRFQHALIAPGAPATIARNYAPAVHYRPPTPLGAPLAPVGAHLAPLDAPAVHYRPPAPLGAPLAPQFGAPYYGAAPFGAWQGRR